MTEETGDSEKPAKIRVRRRDGQWEDLPESPPLSDDPEVNAIGRLSMSEVRRIVEDEADPRHAAAVEFNRLLGDQMAPLFTGLVDSLYKGYGFDGLTDTIRRSLGSDTLAETIRSSVGFDDLGKQLTRSFSLHYGDLVADVLPKVPAAFLPELPEFAQAAMATEIGTAPPSDGTAEEPGGQAVDLPQDQDLLADILLTTQAHLVVAEALLTGQSEQHATILRQLEAQDGQLDVLQKGFAADRGDAKAARDEATAAKADSAQAKTTSKTANRLAGWAIVVAVIFGIASIAISIAIAS